MIFAIVVLVLCLLPLVYVLVMRVAKPHSKKMGRPTPSASTSTGGQQWFMKYLWTIVLAVMGLVVFFQGVYLSEWKSPSFTAVGNWSWSHWLPLLVLWGIGAALLALNKKVLVTAEPILQSLLMGIMAMLFLVCPVLGWFEGPTTQRPTAATVQGPTRNVCQDVNAMQTSSCVITREWSNWIKPENSARDVGKQFCFQPKMPMERKDEGGSASWRFRIEGEEHTTLLYRLGANCNTVVF